MVSCCDLTNMWLVLTQITSCQQIIAKKGTFVSYIVSYTSFNQEKVILKKTIKSKDHPLFLRYSKYGDKISHLTDLQK